jgi:hypothetical protein
MPSTIRLHRVLRAKPNTLHLSILMAFSILIVLRGLA